MHAKLFLSGLVLVGALLAVAPVAANAAPLNRAASVATSVQLPSIISELPALAQASDDSSSGGSTRVRTRGIGKLIGLVVVVLLAAGKFVIGMFTGKGGGE